MPKRRGKQEGTVFERSNGTWRAQVWVGGRRINFTGRTKAECQKWLRQTNLQIERGFTFEGANARLEDFLADWLVSISSSRAKSTIERYQWIVENEIQPFLGHYKIRDLKPDLVQGFYDFRLKGGRSNYMVRTAHKVLSIAMEHAVKLGTIARNPCKATNPPKVAHKEMNIFDENQIQILLAAAEEKGDQYYPLYYLAIHTGMRQGELIGLKWDDVAWEKRTLRVRRQVVRFRDGSYAFTKPKSRNGSRTIILGEQVIQVLRKQLHRVWLLQEKHVGKWEDHDLVFPTRVGTPIQNCNLRRSFRSLLKKAGLPSIRFHDLRHTAASLMLNYGIPVLIVSRRLGHAKPSITLDVYGHLLPSQQEEAAKLMDELMTPIAIPIAPNKHQDAKKPSATP